MSDKNLDLILNSIFEKKSNNQFEDYQILSKFSHKLIPHWFKRMIEDKARNDYYKDMIKGRVTDKIVIDLGSGTGMWAIEALSQGAKFVYLVENNPILVKYLQKIFHNSPVKIINKDILTLTATDFDLGEPEVIIHEVFSTNAIAEGLIPYFKKINSITKKKLIYLPQFLYVEAVESSVKPLLPFETELNFLGDNLETYYEVIYPSKIRSRTPNEFKSIDYSKKIDLCCVDIAQINDEYQILLAELPLNLKGGHLQHVHFGFRFSGPNNANFFSTLESDSHWGSMIAEFYVPNKIDQTQKSFRFIINDLRIDSFIIK